MSSRGPDPSDPRLFRPDVVPTLREACADLSWLRGRGYAETAALKLVGDRFQLAARQRHAIARSACTEAERQRRAAHHVDITGQPVAIDGFNTLILLERALGGGPLFRGRDGVLRDIGGVHGTYRTVEHTPAVVERLQRHLSAHDVHDVWLLLDRPVSNSGRLATLIRDAAPTWTVDVDEHVDRRLAASDRVVCSADGWILDEAPRWHALVPSMIDALVPAAWVVDLLGPPLQST